MSNLCVIRIISKGSRVKFFRFRGHSHPALSGCTSRLKQVSCWFSSESVSQNESEASDHQTDEEKILLCVNTFSAEQMRQDKRIPYNISEEICKHRETKGPFSSLDELKKVKKVGPKTFTLIYERLRTDFPRKGQQQSTLDEDSVAKYTNPVISPGFIKSLSTVTSLEVCLDSVYFATMTRDLEMVDWNHITLLGSGHQRQPPAQILEQAFHILDHLPVSSVYLMENRLNRKMTPHYLQMLMFIGRLQMAIQALINKDFERDRQHKLLHVKDSFVTKTFELRVGGERVSGQHVVKQIQDDQYQDRVVVAPELWRRYNRLESVIFKERYANCLLMALAFSKHMHPSRPMPDESSES